MKFRPSKKEEPGGSPTSEKRGERGGRLAEKTHPSTPLAKGGKKIGNLWREVLAGKGTKGPSG